MKPPTILPGAVEMGCFETVKWEEQLGTYGLQGGSVPGDWHQQQQKSGPSKALRQKANLNPVV